LINMNHPWQNLLNSVSKVQAFFQVVHYVNDFSMSRWSNRNV
jgi:hypothetical protein